MQKLILFCVSFAVFFSPVKGNAQIKQTKDAAKTKNVFVEKEKKLSEIEQEILSEVNAARENPARYVGYLEEIKKAMKGKIRFIPPDIQLLTLEGIESVDDAIIELKKISVVKPYKISDTISKAARKHLADLKENPKLGHFGKDGSDPFDRIESENVFPRQASENILHNTDSAREIVLRMIIDDGIKSRSHRKNIFSENFNTIGVAYGIGKNGEPIVVMNFADLSVKKDLK